MRNRPQLTLATAAILLSGAALTLRGAVARGLAAEARPCDAEQCRCESCGAVHCCVVPETKTTKKWVYATKLVPYCRNKCPNPFDCRTNACDKCPHCDECVRYKRVLVKREVISTKRGYKCVPACEACRARNEVPSSPPASPSTKGAVAQPGEPTPVPATPGPTQSDSGG